MFIRFGKYGRHFAVRSGSYKKSPQKFVLPICSFGAKMSQPVTSQQLHDLMVYANDMHKLQTKYPPFAHDMPDHYRNARAMINHMIGCYKIRAYTEKYCSYVRKYPCKIPTCKLCFKATPEGVMDFADRLRRQTASEEHARNQSQSPSPSTSGIVFRNIFF